MLAVQPTAKDVPVATGRRQVSSRRTDAIATGLIATPTAYGNASLTN
jgi:hypothetical protein